MTGHGTLSFRTHVAAIQTFDESIEAFRLEAHRGLGSDTVYAALAIVRLILMWRTR